MLTISNLEVAYAEKIVLHDVSLHVKPGEIAGIIGPNGAGKTTVIRAVSGTTAINKGVVSVDGKDVTGLSHIERARTMAVVPQARQMGGAYSVRQAVMMGRTAHMGWLGRENEADKMAVNQAIAHTNLIDLADRQIAKLSGGEQQRVLLARALAQQTPVLLLDEPTSHLDLRHQADLLQLIKELVRAKQLAVLFAMHDLNLVSAVADTVALLVNGRMAAQGTPGEVLTPDLISSAYRTPVTVIRESRGGKPFIFPRDLF